MCYNIRNGHVTPPISLWIGTRMKTKAKMFADLRKKGAGAWNDLTRDERACIDLTGLDIQGAKLPGLDLAGRKDLANANFANADLTEADFLIAILTSANFAGANLTEAVLDEAKCEKAIFRDAVLIKTDFGKAKLNGADFTNANLSKAILYKADLRGADFTGAKLAGANLGMARHDGTTTWPARYSPPGGRIGGAPKPVKLGSLNFPAFFESLKNKVDPGRLANAKSMLKAEKFELFAEVTDAALTGIVKSQSSKDRVYACRVASDGKFGCGTQNLRPCGGLAGKVCKHILVLVLGLAKANKIDSALAAAWLDASRANAPEFDKEQMSDTFLKYKGAEAGEVDWRPTETLPEDFYAL
jgi:hypothetical protein